MAILVTAALAYAGSLNAATESYSRPMVHEHAHQAGIPLAFLDVDELLDTFHQWGDMATPLPDETEAAGYAGWFDGAISALLRVWKEPAALVSVDDRSVVIRIEQAGENYRGRRTFPRVIDDSWLR